MEKPPTNPVLAEHVEKFRSFVLLWQDRLNLKNWRIIQSSKKASRGNMAEIARTYVSDHLASWQIGEDFGALPVDDYNIEQAAVHELCHVLLAPLIKLAKDGASADHIAAEEHSVIITLVDLLVPKK